MGLFGEVIAEVNTRSLNAIFDRYESEHTDPNVLAVLRELRGEVINAVQD